ncbi:hypothetical protein [Arthrobacter sp. YN]|uniref:hypothetical protein n=1 Tax=Arthrobacter sp. YN TaxID=2020486 RepID=UPI0012FE3BF9|nr:hypothetical protein [Arthrobacter sp. YN]
MSMPSPENLQRAPQWETYIVTQTVRATLGLIPEHALAVGVEIRGAKIKLLFQLTEVSAEDETDMDDILSELEANVGQNVEVECAYEIRQQRKVLPGARGGIWWVYLARVDEDPATPL